MIDLEIAHKQSSQHREEVLASETCGCFFCLEIFPPGMLGPTTDEGQTYICPFCEVDTIIGAKAGFPISKLFLSEMFERWFGEVVG